jgi:hypothetical protein
MAFWVKDSPYWWSPVKELWVKVADNGPGAWQLVQSAWVKVASTGSSAWKKFYTITSLKPYSTVPVSIRTGSYSGTNVSGSYTYVGTKLWGNESVTGTNYWVNGPFTSTVYKWYWSTTNDGQNLNDTYETTDTLDSTYYDGNYIYFQVTKTNSRGLKGTEISSPAYVSLHVPTHGTNSFGLTTNAAQVGTPIGLAYSWKNSTGYGIDTTRSTIEWYRGYPYADKRNLIESKTYSQLIATSYGSDYYGVYNYTPTNADINNNIYVVSTAYNSYTDYPGNSPYVDMFYSDVIYTKPTINSQISVSKNSGYQTYGYSLSANTQTYTPTVDTVYWGWQYASSNTATTGRSFYHYLPITYIQVNDFGSDSTEGGTHTLTLRDVLDSATGNSVSLVGKYLRFYSIGQKGGAQSDVTYSDWVGPIYQVPTAISAGPSVSFAGPYNSSYAYIRATWNAVDSTGYTKDYTLQYKSGSSWIDLVTLTDAPVYVSTDSYLVPVGSQIFRVRTRNDDGINLYSPETTYVVTAAYSFAFGNYLYPNTNGQVGLDSGVSTVYPSYGRAIGVYPLDLAETTTGYYSDNRYFYIQFSGYQYQNVGTATYALRYQVKFDTLNPTYADILICNKGSSVPLTVTSPGLYNGSSAVSGLPGPYYIGTNTTYRIYMDGSTGSFGQSQAQIPSANFITDSLASGTADDGYHSILTATNQYQKNMLSVNSASVNSSGISVSFSGLNDYSTYNYELRTGSYNGSLWNSLSSQTANPLSIGGLVSGTRYYLTITPYNSLGQPGNVYQNFFDAPSLPQAFTTTSGSKGFPSGAVQSTSQPTGDRTVTVSWNSSANSAVYEVALQGSSDNATWSYVTIGGAQQTLDNSAYVMSGTSKTFTAPYYKYYRYTVRGRGSDYNLSNAAYSDYGSSTSLVWKNVDGTNPSAPTINSITPGTGSSYNTASATFTMTSSPGSNTIDWSQYSLDGSNWSNIYSGTINLSGLSASTGYYLYMRSLNYDGLYSVNTSQYFTTNAAPSYLTAPTPSSVSKSGSNFNVYFSGGSGPYYQTYWTAVSGVPTATTYDANGSSSPISVTNLTSPSMGTTYYFSVRSVSALTNTGTGTSTSLTISPWSSTQVSYYHPYVPTVSMSANSGITQIQATINWTSTNQSYAYVDGTYVGNVTTKTFTGLSADTPYSGTVTVYSTDGYSASASYSFRTSANLSYTITYDGNGSTGGSTASTTGNGSVTLRANGFTRTNCSFTGWNTNSAGTGTGYSAGSSYSLSANVTLYATWAAVANSSTNPTVTFVGNFGSGSTSYKRWNWSGGTVTGGTAVGYQYAISSTSATSGFGSYSATTTATTIDITVANAASNPRWLKVRRVYTDGLGVTQYSGANNGV